MYDGPKETGNRIASKGHNKFKVDDPRGSQEQENNPGKLIKIEKSLAIHKLKPEEREGAVRDHNLVGQQVTAIRNKEGKLGVDGADKMDHKGGKRNLSFATDSTPKSQRVGAAAAAKKNLDKVLQENIENEIQAPLNQAE